MKFLYYVLLGTAGFLMGANLREGHMFGAIFALYAVVMLLWARRLFISQ